MSTIRHSRPITIATTLLFILLFSGCAAKGPPYQCYLGSYSGRILDMDTGEPLKGVVVHITYTWYGSSVAGAIGTPVAVRETLTDSHGEYRIPEETILHKCFSGRTYGSIQIFKPGYGYLGKARKSCPEEEKEKVRWADGLHCVVRPGKYLIWELPRLKTKEERRYNLGRIHPASLVPDNEQILLFTAINEERRFLGLSTKRPY